MDRTHKTAALPMDVAGRLRTLLWPSREPELADAGKAGEITIARARLVVVALLLLPSLATTLRDPSAPSGWLGIAVVAVCLVVGIAVLRRARSGNAGESLPTFATLLDITLVSGYHVLLFLAGEANMVLNSRTIFTTYVIAIVGSALRYDGRLVRVAGLVAVLQYLAVVAWAGATARIAAGTADFYGDTTLIGQSEEVSILFVATVLGAIIVERARELRLSGILDPLTKLANRSYFGERFQSELQRAHRAQRPVAVAMIDIDRFKQINDTHGHAAGDLVLRYVAAELKRSLRRDELVARLGGEEFAMLLFGNTREEAQRRLEALRVALRSIGIELERGVGARVTVSIGLAMSPEDGTEASQLLKLADTRLLAGKRAGRDRIVAVG